MPLLKRPSMFQSPILNRKKKRREPIDIVAVEGQFNLVELKVARTPKKNTFYVARKRDLTGRRTAF